MFGAIWRNKCMYVGIYKKFVLLKFNIFRLSWLNLWMWSLQKRDTSYTKLISIHILVEKSLKHQYKKKQMLLQRGCCFFFFLGLFKNKRTFVLKYSLYIGLCLVTFLLLWQPTITGEVIQERVFWDLAYTFRG